MQKTTYLLGAGASVNALPAMVNLYQELSGFKCYLGKIQAANKTDWDPRIEIHLTDLQHLVDLIDELLENVQSHETVDTLARKYWLQSDWERYENVKIVLCSYFFFRQLIPDDISKLSLSYSTRKLNVDKRYDSLFAHYLDKASHGSVIASPNVNIITWNYDLQIEFALMNFVTLNSINEIKLAYQIHPNRGSFDSTSRQILDSNKFHVVKLNGNAFFDMGHDDGKIVTVYDRLIGELSKNRSLSHDFILAELLTTLSEVRGFSIGGDNTFLKYFNFSWEKNDGEFSVYPSRDLLIEEISKSVSESDILIVVGYSFPNFNYDVDKKWLSKSKFKKIIIQDKNPELIKARLINVIPQGEDNDFRPTIMYQGIGQYFPVSL